MLKGKNVVLGVTGGIAAYKAADLASKLNKMGANVDVIMTKSATSFVTPLTFRSITGRPVVTDMFEEPAVVDIKHISLASKADIFIVAPATANILGKVACGICDDMLSTTIAATKSPVIFAPAMNTNMYENPIIQENIEKLKKLGYLFVEPECGRLACGTEGKGRLAENQVIIEKIVSEICFKKDLLGKKVLVTAGPTREYLDPVRFISNPSSGKMGYAVALAAKRRGADVVLISGPTNLTAPEGVEMVYINTAVEMYDEVLARAEDADIIVKSAAVGDFRPVSMAEHKMKKDDVSKIELVKNPDILQEVCKKSKNAVVVGFCMETRDLEQQAYTKLINKGADFIVANNVAEEGSGFAGDNNTALIISKDGYLEHFGNMPKQELADIILNKAMEQKKA